VNVKELCRKHGFSDGSFYIWRSKYGGMDVSEAQKLKTLESENQRLKKLLAEAHMDLTHSRLLPGESDKPATEA
jgi:putative transposase